MMLPIPFAYPAVPHRRRHGPRGYKDYGNYKPFLRDEFVFRCVYCLEREMWYPNRGDSFSVEHFIPKTIEPDKERDYENLLYACVRCNTYKQTSITLLDPTKVAFSDYFSVNEDGYITGLSPEANDLLDLLDLNNNPALEERRKALCLLRLKKRLPDVKDVHDLFISHFAYPEDLPDLESLRPPDGNVRPEGIQDSHLARKKRNELAEVY